MEKLKKLCKRIYCFLFCFSGKFPFFDIQKYTDKMEHFNQVRKKRINEILIYLQKTPSKTFKLMLRNESQNNLNTVKINYSTGRCVKVVDGKENIKSIPQGCERELALISCKQGRKFDEDELDEDELDEDELDEDELLDVNISYFNGNKKTEQNTMLYPFEA